jgi:dihydrofolate reductase
MYDFAGGWGDNPPFHMPVFVLSHQPRETLVKDGGTTFTFVSGSIENVLAQARAAAGGKDVSVGGGASIIQQCLNAGMVDEFQVHIVPLLLGAGRRLFDNLTTTPTTLEINRVMETPGVTHIRYRVVK